MICQSNRYVAAMTTVFILFLAAASAVADDKNSDKRDSAKSESAKKNKNAKGSAEKAPASGPS